MPPIRDHEEEDDEEDTRDDEDMPSLVDPPMTYTFYTEMTPLSFDSTAASPDLSLVPFTFSSMDEPTPGPQPPPPRTSHGKRRDASYIPRPPNAFILFRSSFIRSQQVTGKVEGNHSNLSKIIGMYWKTLPKEERDEWEAKAALAQLEHRKRYPDWRFRPGSNALAKLKIKDGGAGPSRPRRIRGAKDPPDGGGGEDDSPVDEEGKGKGRARAKSVRGRGKEKEEPNKGKDKSKEDTRFAKIADLLVEGKKGVELEIAVKEWEGGRKGRKRAKRSTSQDAGPSTRETEPSSSNIASPAPPVTHSPISTWTVATPLSTPVTPDTDDIPPSPLRRIIPHQRSYPRPSRSRSRSPSPSNSHFRSRSRSPSPHQHPESTSPPSHKRSLSAPASHHRLSSPHTRHIPAPSASLPLPHEVQVECERERPLRVGRKGGRHRASASVSFSMKDHPRFGQSSPLAQHPPVQGPASRGLEGGPVPFPVSSSPAREAAPHSHHQLHVQRGYYPPQPQPPRLMWQEEEERRRMEVERGYAYWWRGEGPGGRLGEEMYEPVREGSFEFGSGAEVGEIGMGYAVVGGREGEGLDRRYLELFPPLPHAQTDATSGGIRWTPAQGQGAGRLGLLGPSNALEDTITSTTNTTTTNTTTTTTFAHQTPTSAPQYQGQDAGGYFYPAPVSPLTPFSSSFSSLAGWDGEARLGGAQGAGGGGGGPWYGVPGTGWGRIQPVGLQGGREGWGEEAMGMGMEYGMGGRPPDGV
ncbi:hypothetical protein FPV67DRAFT_1597470 [Lyophyllum atratum]|nr:hypothetical protein FPV67DRAFT_1597470 [Lyophyllum atratum]